MKYLSNQKLWKVIREPTGYYYEIKLAGMVIDRIEIGVEAICNLMDAGVINGSRENEEDNATNQT